MRNKRIFRWIVLTAVIALLLGMLSSNAAEDKVFFTAINDNLLELKDSTMPLYYKEAYYMPLSVFNDSSIGIWCSYNKDIYKLTFYNKKNTLIFDLRLDYAYDNEQQYRQSIIPVNGTLYVPAAFVCSMFGIDFNYINAAPVPILRIVSNSETDSYNFRVRNNDKMRELYYKYMGINPSPSQPQTSSGGKPSQEPSGHESGDVYFTFDCRTGDRLTEILNALDAKKIKAAFFLTGDVIADNRDAVARMMGEGHTVGILGETGGGDASVSAKDALLTQASQVNEALDAAVCAKTRLFRFHAGSSNRSVTKDMRGALADAGYIYWDWTLDTTKYGNVSAEKLSAKTQAALEKSDQAAVLRFDASAATAGALPKILRFIQTNHYTTRLISPGGTPVRLAG